MELSDTDELAALWLNNYIADAPNKPHTGDKFIMDLLAQRTVFLAEPGSPKDGPLAPPLRELSPAELARRVLAQRKAMAARTTRFPQYVEGANMTVRHPRGRAWQRIAFTCAHAAAPLRAGAA